MNKKLILLAAGITAASLLLSGCNAEFGIKNRNEVNELDKVIHWSSNFTDELSDWAKDLSSLTNLDFESFPYEITNPDNNKNNSGKIFEENLSKSLPISGVSNIDIEICASNVTIEAVAGNDFTINCSGKSSIVTDTEVTLKGSKIKVKENSIKAGNFNLGLSQLSMDRKVIIGIPENYTGDISVVCGAGNLKLNEFNSSNLQIEGGAGNLTMENIGFSNLTLSQGVGNTDIALKRKSGNVDIDGGVGNLTLKLQEVGGNLVYEGGVGNTKIYVPENAPVKFDTETGVGRCSVTAKTSGKTDYIFSISVGVGELLISN